MLLQTHQRNLPKSRHNSHTAKQAANRPNHPQHRQSTIQRLLSNMATSQKTHSTRRNRLRSSAEKRVEQPATRENAITKRLILYSDGGARGNPGPAAIAAVITTEDGQTLTTKTRYIGIHTNNQAEYHALILALETALAFEAEEVICHLDSELVTRQLNGEYTVKNPTLQQLWSKTLALRRQFKKTQFISVPRTNPNIQKADKLLNQTLDTTHDKT